MGILLSRFHQTLMAQRKERAARLEPSAAPVTNLTPSDVNKVVRDQERPTSLSQSQHRSDAEHTQQLILREYYIVSL